VGFFFAGTVLVAMMLSPLVVVEVVFDEASAAMKNRLLPYLDRYASFPEYLDGRFIVLGLQYAWAN
jgi:hypothetical protein